MSKKSKAKESQKIANLLAFQATSLQETDQRFAEIEHMTDPAKKIMELQELNDSIQSVIWKNNNRLYLIVEPRIKRFCHTWSSQDRQEDAINKLLLVENPGFRDFADKTEAHKARALKMLDEIVINHSLDEFASSPLYSKAYKSHEPLRDLFTAEAAARAALGDKAARKKTDAAPAKPASGYRSSFLNGTPKR